MIRQLPAAGIPTSTPESTYLDLSCLNNTHVYKDETEELNLDKENIYKHIVKPFIWFHPFIGYILKPSTSFRAHIEPIRDSDGPSKPAAAYMIARDQQKNMASNF